MENQNNITVDETNTFKDYLNLIRNNILPVVLISLTSLAVAVIYALNAQNIYKSTNVLKISKPQGNILEAPLMPEFQDFGNDRFIANEIEILKSYNIREKVAYSLTDSFKFSNINRFSLIMEKGSFNENTKKLKSIYGITRILESYVSIDQKRGLDIVEINVESPSPSEASLIANVYAQEYKNLNLEINRNQLTTVKNFLEDQRKEKQNELKLTEENLKGFQEKKGLIALDEQATNLISQLSDFEAKKNAAQIELAASTKVLNQYKVELEKQDPRLADYIESLSSEEYIQTLQKQLASMQITKDLTLGGENSKKVDQKVINDYNNKISDLNDKLEIEKKKIKAGILASSPEQVRELTQRIIEEEIKNQSLKITAIELNEIVKQYDQKFNKLPQSSIELARLQRNRESLEKLYLLVEEKYQEALINEQSQPGNVLIIDSARIPLTPSKPNRTLIIVIGLVLGLGMAFGYIMIKNYFDNTIKTPEDMQKRNINVLAWIPQIEGISQSGTKEFEFIVAKKPDSIPSEAFRALRTRVHYSKINADSLKTILITSSAPQEGKTTICVNLAGSFAQANKKALVLDCDLRKPRVHSVFNTKRVPGLIDYLFGHVKIEDVIHESELPNLYYITSGTIPPNPAEMLESQAMIDFLSLLKERFDIILIDSPPVIAVTDSEILAKEVNASILVVSAETTEIELMQKSIELLKKDSASFIGTVLNNFSYKSGYGSYYKYYYYYSRPSANGNKDKESNKNLNKEI